MEICVSVILIVTMLFGVYLISIMVVLLESYLQNLEKHATELALTFGIAPKTFRQYVDDSHA